MPRQVHKLRKFGDERPPGRRQVGYIRASHGPETPLSQMSVPSLASVMLAYAAAATYFDCSRLLHHIQPALLQLCLVPVSMGIVEGGAGKGALRAAHHGHDHGVPATAVGIDPVVVGATAAPESSAAAVGPSSAGPVAFLEVAGLGGGLENSSHAPQDSTAPELPLAADTSRPNLQSSRNGAPPVSVPIQEKTQHLNLDERKQQLSLRDMSCATATSLLQSFAFTSAHALPSDVLLSALLPTAVPLKPCLSSDRESALLRVEGLSAVEAAEDSRLDPELGSVLSRLDEGTLLDYLWAVSELEMECCDSGGSASEEVVSWLLLECDARAGEIGQCLGAWVE